MIFKRIYGIYKNRVKNNHIKYFFKKNGNTLSNGKTILIYAGIGKMYISYFEVLLYHLLKREGYCVEYLIYDENIYANELITKKVVETKGKDKFWNREVGLAKQFLKNSYVKYEFINANRNKTKEEVNNIKTLEEVYTYTKDGLALGKIVKGTMYRYYKSLTFGEDAFIVAKNFLHTALTNYYEIKERTSKNDYSYIMLSHGIYVTWGPVVEFCKKENIEFIVYDRAKTNNTIGLNFNQVAPDWSFDSAWDRYNDKQLKKEEIDKIHELLKDRELQSNDVYAYNFAERSSDIVKLKENLKIPKDKKIITLFTNLIWDAANVSRDIAFKNAFQCIIETIEHYRNNNSVHIILRTHPAEKVLGTEERYGDLVRDFFKESLPSNVTIVEPENNINSFSIIDLSDIGIVNTSTVGLEFALLGKPVVLISETHYRNKGFTYDVTSSNDYFETIDKLLKEQILLPDQIALAQKYFYIMMFKYQHLIPIEFKNNIFVKYNYSNLDGIPKTDDIYKIVDRLKVGKPKDFIFWD